MVGARLVADGGVACDVAPCEPEPDVPFGEDDESPLVVCLTGLGSGGTLPDGVEIAGVVRLGVVTLGVEMLGVVMLGVVTRGVVTGGAVTDGTVTAGTVTAGTVTVGTLTVGTETVGTLIVGTDATEAAAGMSSAPQAMSPAIACRRMGRRTSHRSPPDPSATEGLDIAHRLHTGPLLIGPRARI